MRVQPETLTCFFGESLGLVRRINVAALIYDGNPIAGFAASGRLSPLFSPNWKRAFFKKNKTKNKKPLLKLPSSSLPHSWCCGSCLSYLYTAFFPRMFFCSSATVERCGGGQIGIMARRAFYPLYQLGNPPTRIFRTDYFLTLVRPGVPLPEDTVQFRIPMDMTRVELKEYLEKIYNVPVAAVRTRIQFGSNKQRDDRNRRIKKPDYKVAYVQLGIEKRLSPGETGCKFQAVWIEGSAFKFFEGEKIWEKILGINLDDKLLKDLWFTRTLAQTNPWLKQVHVYRKFQAEGQTFQFPDLFPDKDKAPEPESSEEIENKIEKEKQKKINDLKRGDVPNWFWH